MRDVLGENNEDIINAIYSDVGIPFMTHAVKESSF